MGTKDRILAASLALFNEEGEANVSTVDIAAVLNISPGNLYYHFKGKEPIIRALFADFEEEMKLILSSPIKKALDFEDNWIFFYIMLEEMYSFRFFYFSLTEQLARDTGLSRRFRTLMVAKTQSFAAIVGALTDQKFLTINQQQQGTLCERLMMQLTFWPSYQRLVEPDSAIAPAIHKGVYALMGQLVPFVRQGQAQFQDFLADFFTQKIREQTDRR